MSTAILIAAPQPAGRNGSGWSAMHPSGEGVEPPIREGTAAGLHSLARCALADDRIESQAPAKSIQREDHHEHEQEEIGPRPLALGVVQAEPQIQDLERADPAPEAHEQAE